MTMNVDLKDNNNYEEIFKNQVLYMLQDILDAVVLTSDQKKIIQISMLYVMQTSSLKIIEYVEPYINIDTSTIRDDPNILFKILIENRAPIKIIKDIVNNMTDEHKDTIQKYGEYLKSIYQSWKKNQ